MSDLRRPHALHRVLAPSGPRRHSGVSALLQLWHLPGGAARLTTSAAALKRGVVAGGSGGPPAWAAVELTPLRFFGSGPAKPPAPPVPPPPLPCSWKPFPDSSCSYPAPFVALYPDSRACSGTAAFCAMTTSRIRSRESRTRWFCFIISSTSATVGSDSCRLPDRCVWWARWENRFVKSDIRPVPSVICEGSVSIGTLRGCGVVLVPPPSSSLHRPSSQEIKNKKTNLVE